VKNITWAKGIDENGRPIYDDANRPGDPPGRPTARRASRSSPSPSFLGGKNWMPMAYSQKTGLFYVPSNEWGMDIWNEPITYKKGAAYLGAGFTIKPIFDDHIGVAEGHRPGDRRDQVGIQEQGAAVGRRADHRGVWCSPARPRAT
jgi:alcohol dehydrogenase (cytochrome c)